MISDDDVLYRRVPTQSATLDRATGEVRPTSDCFRDSTHPVPSPTSCILASALGERSPDTLVPGPGGDRLVAITVLTVRNLGLDVELAPTDDEPAHVHLVGEKTRSIRRALADAARYVV
jgi:hypothetical protein